MQPQKLGPYRIVRKLGEGGMGTVYEAIDDSKSLRAAVKVLPETLARKQGFRSRFEIEIEALRKLEHPNIVKILGFGEQDGTLFYAMELVEGQDLESVLESQRRLTTTRTIDIGIQLVKALKHAHDRGIIHRDIKPANIMILADGAIKLSDFGIAKRYGNTGLTMEGGPIGTANYMSPEQTEGKKATDRSDLYSVGCLFYSLLAGRPPFVSESLYKILELQRKSRPELVTIFAPNTPEPFAALIDQLLEKEPEKRPANCAVLLRTLTMLQQGLELTGEPAAPPVPPPHAARPQTPQRPPQKPPEGSVTPMGASGKSARSFLNQMGDVTVSTNVQAESDPGFNTRNIEGAGPRPPTSCDQASASQVSGDQTLATNAGGPPAARPNAPAPNQPQKTPATDAAQTIESTMVSGFAAPPSMAGPVSVSGAGSGIVSHPNDSMDLDADEPSGHIATGDTSLGPGEGDTLVSGAGLNQPRRSHEVITPTFTTDPGPATGVVTSDSIIELTTSVPEAAPLPKPQIKKADGMHSPLVPPTPSLTTSATFVTAEQAAKADREREDLERLKEPATPIIGRGTIIFLILTCLFCATWYYFTRPASADKLFRTIMAAAATSNPDTLEEVDGEIREFLNRFPADERAPRIKEYSDEVDLIKTERRLQIKSRRLTGAFSGTPAQQIYLAALAASRIDPETGLARFEAFIGLYEAGIKSTQSTPSGDMDDEAKETAKYIELARRRAKQLKQETTQQKASQLILIRQQLSMAQRVAAKDPARARTVCESILVLYSQRPWAAQDLVKVRDFLSTLPVPTATAPATTAPSE